MRASRNAHGEKTVAAKEELKEVKKKNRVLTKVLSAEKTKSVEINHRAWLDKEANLPLLTGVTKSHQAELKIQQGEDKEKLQDKPRRIKEEMSEQEKKLSAESLLRSYLQRKYEKMAKELQDEAKGRRKRQI